MVRFPLVHRKTRDRTHYETTAARPAVLRYGVGVAAVAASTLIAVWLRPFSPATPFLCFYPAVFFAVWFGGLRPGLLATLLSSLAANYYLLSPQNGFSWDLPGIFGPALFAAGLVGICYLAEIARQQFHSVIRVQSQLLDAAFEPIIIRDAEDKVIYWNAGAERLYGWTANEALGECAHTLLKTRFLQPVEQVLSDFKREGRWQGELTHTTKDGRTIVVASSWTLNANGNKAATLDASFDLTELRRTQESLREGARQLAESAERLDIAEKAADLGVWSWEVGQEEFIWTEKCRALFGFAPGHPVNYEVFRNALHPDDREHTDRAVQQAIQHKSDYEAEYRVTWPDASTHWIIAKGRVVSDQSGGVVRLAGIAVDITSRKNAEQALRESEETLRTIFNNGHDAVILHQVDGSIVDVNDRFLAMYGVARQDVEHLSIADISSSASPVKTLPALLAKVMAGKSQFFEWRALRPHDGCEFDVEVFLSRIQLRGQNAVLANVRDITARKRAEEEKRLLQIELAHAQKMEAIGLMAGGVAHDFNNLLNVISGYSELALANPEQALDSLTQIRKATKTATAVTRQLLAFSRKDVLEPQTVEVCAVVRETAAMLPNLLGNLIRVQTEICSEPCAARMALGQLEQVIINLAVNARDAMPSGGTLTLKVATGVIEEARRRVLDGLPQAGYVICSFTDTGHGIPADMLPRVFEPFFTTKNPGEGTGFGLATVRAIVDQNGGRIFVESVPGRGTTFTLYLPLVTDVLTRVPQGTGIAVEFPRGSETILLVEDSASLCEMTKVFLQTQGYSVSTASDGVEALKLLARYGAHFDLLFTDVVMPLMSGPELARQAKQLRPQIKVLFASGYAGELLKKNGMSTGQGNFITKPYSFESLSSNIRDIFDASPLPQDVNATSTSIGK